MTAMPQPPTCPIPNCTRPVGKHKLLCAPCWSAVPPDLQRRVHRTYRAWLGHMGDADLMREYQDAKTAAIQAV